VHRLLDTDGWLRHLREMKNDCGKHGKVRSRQKWQSWGGQRVSREMLPGFRMTLLLLNRGDPGVAALKEAGPVDSGALGGEKHSRSHGRPPFPVTTPHTRTVLAFRGGSRPP
jgi:hypothetical protein